MKQPCGKDTIGSFMKKISEEANLSQTYTNQCVGRATAITLLDRWGYTDEEITYVSKHHNTESKFNMDNFYNGCTS